MQKLFEYNKDFVTFGSQHIQVMVALTLLCVLLPWWGLSLSPLWKLVIARGMALCMASAVVLWTILQVGRARFDTSTDYPFDLCNLMALLAPVGYWHPQLFTHEIFYYLVLAGTFQAVLTPHLHETFPHIDFLKYWIVHGGLVVQVIFVTVVFGLYPTPLGMLHAFLAVLLYVPSVALANVLTGANYAYVMHKPSTASLLDFLGPWPWYIVSSLMVGVVLFVLCYLPVWWFAP